MDVRLASTINPALRRVERASQETAPVLGYLLVPVALSGYVLAIWRLAADLKWVGEFFIAQGLLSHWQVWLALSVAIHMLATFLNRFGRPDDSVLS
jgi:hypothetical protein